MDTHKTAVLLLSLLLLLVCVGTTSATLDPKRTVLVDWSAPESGASNFLFRSNMPTTKNESFAYAELLSVMSQRVAESNATVAWPGDGAVYLVDISLLDPLEIKDEDIEKEFFKAHPTAGEYINWPIVGDLVRPYDLPHNVMDALAKAMPEWDVDELPKRIPLLYKWLNTAYDTPRVFLFHCEAGDDRTGEVAASYKQAYAGWTLPQVMAWDTAIAGREPRWMSVNAICWHCWYLQEAKGLTGLDCDQAPPPSPGPP